jgi:[acyl-carrier-protein] S-malonyltransferase
LSPWLELDGFEDRMRWLSAVAGVDLVAHGTTSDADTIRDTAVAQPLIVASGLAAMEVLIPVPDDVERVVTATAGHSVGEITAAAVAGVLSPEQALVFVRERGRAMAEASAVTPTGMSAVLGGDPDEVSAVLARHGLTAANANGGGQVVAAGTLEQLKALENGPPAKTRVVPLQVAGAFHTTHMAPAVDVLTGHARGITPRDPRVQLLSNRDGTVVRDGREFLDRLVNQVSNPVRWDLCQQSTALFGLTAVLELLPAGTLANLGRRALRGVETLPLQTAGELDAARAFVERHGASMLALDPSGSST